MTDREKVIGHLNDCMEASRRDNTWVFVRKDVVEDTISLLKEQEKLEERLQHAVEAGEEYRKECKNKYENGFNDAMLGKQELMYEGTDGKWHKKDW